MNMIISIKRYLNQLWPPSDDCEKKSWEEEESGHQEEEGHAVGCHHCALVMVMVMAMVIVMVIVMARVMVSRCLWHLLKKLSWRF